MPESVHAHYWSLKAFMLDHQNSNVKLVPPKKNAIGLWDLAYVQPNHQKYNEE